LKNVDLPYLYQRFLEGESTEDELQLLFHHFGTSSEDDLRLLIRAELANDQTEINHDWEHDAKMQHLYQGITRRIDRLPDHHKVVRIWRIAASIAATLVIVSGYFLLHHSQTADLKTVYAAYGKRIEVLLPDSSKVWLNSGSTLQYPVAFNSANRTISLKDGEAYFEVIHDARKPFIVHAGGVDVNVLGTSFEISAFAKDKETKVTVSTGKVGVLQPTVNTPANFLLPGEREIINRITHQIQTVKVDLSDIAAWRNDRLIFDDEPIAEAMRTLERKYNVHIEIQNTHLLIEKISMRLNNQPLTDILTAISFANHFNYEKINDQLIVIK
jgi:ferric-dicitrate binding protein FerR (iron transport regulator)